MRWLPRASWPAVAGKLNLSVMSAAFVIFDLRWSSSPIAGTPRPYHVLLLIFSAQVWGLLFLASGAGMGLAAWHFGKR